MENEIFKKIICEIKMRYSDCSFFFKRDVFRRIFGPVYDNKRENWRILTNKEIYASVKKPDLGGTR